MMSTLQIKNGRYLAGVPSPAFLLTSRVRSSTFSTSNTFRFMPFSIFNYMQYKITFI